MVLLLNITHLLRGSAVEKATLSMGGGSSNSDPKSSLSKLKFSKAVKRLARGRDVSCSLVPAASIGGGSWNSSIFSPGSGTGSTGQRRGVGGGDGDGALSVRLSSLRLEALEALVAAVDVDEDVVPLLVWETCSRFSTANGDQGVLGKDIVIVD